MAFFSTKALCFLVILFTIQVSAQSQSTLETNFSCSANSSPPSCQTYVAYFAQPPEFMDLENISDLFGVSRLQIATASNLVSEFTWLIPDQLLLVPLTCGCNGSHYFANITYTIKKDDTYYAVSIHAFENLTNWPVVVDSNPTLAPNLLQIGTKVIFPLFCKCPSKAHRDKGITSLITYVWQPKDDIFRVSSKFNASTNDIITENNSRNFTAAVASPVLIPVTKFPALSQPNPFRKKHKLQHRWILVAIISSAGALLLLLLATLFVRVHSLHERKKILNRNDSMLETSDLLQTKKLKKTDKFNLHVKQDKLLPGVSGYLGKPIIYEIEAIMESTMNCHEHSRIGGSVYRAVINGTLLAVKKAKEDVNHANLVKLMGISSDSDGNFFLVYEYAENGSLDKWLRSKCPTSSSSVSFLTWNQRLSIALDVANGLQYMHEHTRPSVVHRDIRTSNILLDSRFKAKIANFSLARPTSNVVVPKVDVFAFGIVLLELLSGRKAMVTKESGEIVMLWKEATAVLENEEKREERLREWMDPKLEGFYPIDGAMSLTALARGCTLENSLARPSMAEVVFSLSVLTQSEAVEKSWICNIETEEVSQITSPITAR
ncbi:hypothetical protein UlMin_039449 [Ulmus minor]